MTKEGKKAWTISAIIHVIATVLLLGAGLISGCSDSKADPHVFELVGSGDMEGSPMQGSGELPGDVAMPDIDASTPDISPSLPPAEEVLPPPVVSDTPPTIASDTPKKEEPKKVAYDPNKYTSKTSPKTTPKNNSTSQTQNINLRAGDVRISRAGKTGNITGGTGVPGGVGIPGGTGKGTGLSNDEWGRYIVSMRTTIQSNWDQPTDLYADKLYAVVEFTVSKNGMISNVRIVKSSGNSRFDATVRSAFNNTRNVGTVPSGQSEDFSLRFEMD